jgi:hypothetical protein
MDSDHPSRSLRGAFSTPCSRRSLTDRRTKSMKRILSFSASTLRRHARTSVSSDSRMYCSRSIFRCFAARSRFGRPILSLSLSLRLTHALTRAHTRSRALSPLSRPAAPQRDALPLALLKGGNCEPDNQLTHARTIGSRWPDPAIVNHRPL